MFSSVVEFLKSSHNKKLPFQAFRNETPVGIKFSKKYFYAFKYVKHIQSNGIVRLMETVKRLASEILNVGTSRIRIINAEEAKKAITKDDVRKLIKEKSITAIPKIGMSRGRARIRDKRKRLGRRRGIGSKKGSKYAGISAKDLWMRKVRAQRKVLHSYKNKMPPLAFRKIYRMIKGNAFRDKKHLVEYIASFKGV